MKKAGLLLLFLFTVHTIFAAFPKPSVADSTKTVFSDSQSVTIPEDKNEIKTEQPAGETWLSLSQKLLGKLMRFHPHKQDFTPKKSNWVASVGGFLMGLTGIGFAVSRLTHNAPLRNSASAGFKVFLCIIGIYIVAVLAIVVLLVGLRGW